MKAPHPFSAVHSGRLPLLDGLRGIAAICVMLYHLGNVFMFHGPFARAYLFVDLFFLLSGFVLTLAAEAKMNSGWGAAGFMRTRIKRLWPMIAVGAIAGAVQVGMTFGWHDVPTLLLLALLMIPCLQGFREIFPLNGPQWSLFFELVVNLAHSLVLRRLGQRSLLKVVLFSGATLAIVILTSGGDMSGSTASDWWKALPRVLFSYSLGVWMARHARTREIQPILPWQAALILPVVVVVILAELPVRVAIGDIIVALIALPSMFWMATSARVPNQAMPLLSRLGSISFPLYAVHLPILNFFGRFGNSPALMIAAMASALLTAMMLALAMERKVVPETARLASYQAGRPSRRVRRWIPAFAGMPKQGRPHEKGEPFGSPSCDPFKG